MHSQLPTSLGLALLYLTGLFQKTSADDVCYGSLGCFTTNFPFTSTKRPVPTLPWSPEEIGTEFWLYTRFNQFTPAVLSYRDSSTIENSNFSPFRKTKFLIHGFTSQGDNKWVMDLKNVLLNVESINVIVVDWRKGADTPFAYWQAATNTQVVGAEIAALIDLMKDTTGAWAMDFHLIGHSLGSHIGGYAGERVSNLGRITGLDPAGPYFEGTPAVVRLDKTDARFVDAIHTDGDSIVQLGFGMTGKVGHADFYPNGGRDQPGCRGNDVDSGKWWRVSCSHGRSCQLMIDSIKNDAKNPMYGYPCGSYEDYKSGNCNMDCTDGGCPKLGYYSEDTSFTYDSAVSLFLTTASESPYGQTA